MKDQDPLLKIRFEGEAMKHGSLPVPHLLRFLTNMNKAFQRTGRALLQSESESVCMGQPLDNIKKELAMDMVFLTHGSPSVVLGLERRKRLLPLFPEMDFGQEILEKAIMDLDSIQNSNNALPPGCDAGVLLAWRGVGTLFSQGVKRIDFTLNHREKSLVVRFTPEGFTQMQEKIKGPRSNIRTIEGRLLMADFKESGTRCRVHPAVGEPVLCLFDDAQKDEVLEDILHFVRIVGEAKEDSVTGKVTSIKIHDIECLEDRENESTALLPQGTPISRSFWESPSLDELAQAQSVTPLADVRTLFGTWPGEVDDGFEEAINELRYSDMKRKSAG